MGQLHAFTERPQEGELHGILGGLHDEPGILTVFNHPLWDESGIGPEAHRAAAVSFLSKYAEHLHALELNGLRPWRENLFAIRLAQEWSKPVISGGDRHVLEPNATLNLTNASDFAGFAAEVRSGWSDVFVMSHYRTAHATRIFHNILDVFRTYESHPLGWTDWSDRVFYTLEDGSTASVSQLFGDRPPISVGIFAGFMRLAGQPALLSALRATALGAEQVGL
jgi:hypothetical protein